MDPASNRGTSPREAYRQALAKEGFESDSTQERAVSLIDELYQQLRHQSDPRPKRRGLRRLLPGQSKRPMIPGLYLWGGVGRGKTWLMDLLFDALPTLPKQRLHYHAFMQQVHADLRRIRDQRNPLETIATDMAQDCQLLCLDEMQINDITDAMLMAGLLDALFSQGLTLVTTSNLPPDGLYRAGLQRERFLPAIALLNTHCRVVELAGPTDYRLRRLETAPVYLTPLDDTTHQAMRQHFNELVGAHRTLQALKINRREIPTVAWHQGVAWFDFDVICQIPRSQLDYVELARQFHSLLLSNLRCLDDERVDLAHRLMTLVDACYDRNVKLVISAEAEPERLYQGRELAFEFQRTASRLTEMRSTQYLARPHLA